MTAPLPPAQSSESAAAFERLAAPLRREIKVHCYRMMGSLHEAEDLVQETYLRAWRSFAGFDSSGSFRAWTYRIATHACLNALESRRRLQRLLPGQRQPAATDAALGPPAPEVPWLEPYPADLADLPDEAPGPEARYAASEAVQLAFVALIQELPPRQRAALLLCDVLGWTAVETASLLGGSVASINSALQRGRETLAHRYPEGRTPPTRRPDSSQQQTLARYLAAYEAHDLDRLVALLKEDATLQMPPWPQWYGGRAALRVFFDRIWKSCHNRRLLPTSANGQPAFAAYEPAGRGIWTAHSLQVLTLERDAIASLTVFIDAGLFPAFGLPATLTEPAGTSTH